MEREREWERERRLVLYKSTCQSSPNTSAGHRHVTRSQEPGWFRHLAPGWFCHLPVHKVISSVQLHHKIHRFDILLLFNIKFVFPSLIRPCRGQMDSVIFVAVVVAAKLGKRFLCGYKRGEATANACRMHAAHPPYAPFGSSEARERPPCLSTSIAPRDSHQH